MTPDIDETPLPLLPARPTAGHKGTFGTVVVLGGCKTHDAVMLGAPALAALGALRAGAGLARLLAPASVLPTALALCPSATGIPLTESPEGLDLPTAIEEFDRHTVRANALIVGPGLGLSPEAAALTLRSIQLDSFPVGVDADAISLLATFPELWRDFLASAILTPHPGEYRRLASSLGITLDPTDPTQRPHAAAALARRLGCVVVLKGAGTVVSDGLRAWTCTRGHPCMATAGTGDVLAGVIGGLAASSRGLPLYEIARIAVDVHARAGEAWALANNASAGMLAAELAAHIPALLEPLRPR
jgi:NAD(P)H-hydrate epimerase